MKIASRFLHAHPFLSNSNRQRVHLAAGFFRLAHPPRQPEERSQKGQ